MIVAARVDTDEDRAFAGWMSGVFGGSSTADERLRIRMRRGRLGGLSADAHRRPRIPCAHSSESQITPTQGEAPESPPYAGGLSA